jgi:hypothetical protein
MVSTRTSVNSWKHQYMSLTTFSCEFLDFTIRKSERGTQGDKDAFRHKNLIIRLRKLTPLLSQERRKDVIKNL